MDYQTQIDDVLDKLRKKVCKVSVERLELFLKLDTEPVFENFKFKKGLLDKIYSQVANIPDLDCDECADCDYQKQHRVLTQVSQNSDLAEIVERISEN